MPSDDLEAMLKAMARELGRSVERIDVDEIAESFGVDPDRARDWMTMAGGWLRTQTNRGEEIIKHPLERIGPHPLDLPTEEQGLALAALESGRWTVEPGTSMLVSRGEGPGPSDALGLARELHVRDWISADGEITQTGRRALGRWLETV
jgi:hypothetical protein